jgi:hypothetical protein
VDNESSLGALAEKAYGSEDYWTTLWNDNAWITDPEVIAKDTVLKIRAKKPEEAVVLDSVLAERNNAVLKQKNDAYLQQLGYQSAVAALPTIVPVQLRSVNAAPETISEEAITYLGNCEAGMDPKKNTGNGFYGAFQFSHGTWKRLSTGYERADLAPIEVQKTALKQLLEKSSIYGQFPACANKMRSVGLI